LIIVILYTTDISLDVYIVTGDGHITADIFTATAITPPAYSWLRYALLLILISAILMTLPLVFSALIFSLSCFSSIIDITADYALDIYWPQYR